MGYDYVLDLVSEIEVVPGFPACTAYFLVSTDKSRERTQQRKHNDGWVLSLVFLAYFFFFLIKYVYL